MLVVHSNLYTQGTIHVHESVPGKIHVKAGSYVEIDAVKQPVGENSTIIAKLITDKLLSEYEIVLAPRDAERLGVSEGDWVRVKPKQSITESRFFKLSNLFRR